MFYLIKTKTIAVNALNRMNLKQYSSRKKNLKTAGCSYRNVMTNDFGQKQSVSLVPLRDRSPRKAWFDFYYQAALLKPPKFVSTDLTAVVSF